MMHGTQEGTSFADHALELAESFRARITKGKFLDFHLQKKIRAILPEEEQLLYAADKILDALCDAGPDSLPLLKGMSGVTTRGDQIRYYLCLFEIARSIVGKPVTIESDYCVIRGREYGIGRKPREEVTPYEQPYIEGIQMLAVWIKKY